MAVPAPGSMAVPAPSWLLVLGWVFAFLGGAIGLIIGFHIRRAKIVDLDGKAALRYDEGSRRQGLIMIVVGIVMLIVWMIVNISLQHG
jgi:hypothetical protein